MTEKKDYMTMLKPFSEQAPASVSSAELDRERDEPVKAEPPLATLIDHLTEASQPLAFQVLFRPKEDWSHKAKGRRRDIQARTTTSYETGSYNSGPGGGGTSIEYDVGPDEGSDDQMRLDLLDQVNSKQSFFTNVRAFSALVDGGIPPDLDEKLDQICPAFDMFDGEFYRIEGERFGQGVSGRFSAKWSFKRFRERTMKVGSGLIPGTGICQQSGTRNNCLPSNKLRPGGRRIRPDFILDPDELANLLIVPPSSQLSVEAARGARAEQEARNPSHGRIKISWGNCGPVSRPASQRTTMGIQKAFQHAFHQRCCFTTISGQELPVRGSPSRSITTSSRCTKRRMGRYSSWIRKAAT